MRFSIVFYETSETEENQKTRIINALMTESAMVSSKRCRLFYAYKEGVDMVGMLERITIAITAE